MGYNATKLYKKAINPETVKTRVLTLRKMTENDQDKITALLTAVPGVQGVTANPAGGRVTVEYDSSRVGVVDIKNRLWEKGYFVRIASRT